MNHHPTVVPKLNLNLFLDQTLKLQRGPDGVEFQPRDIHCSGDGFVHFSIPTTIGEEAAWWALGYDHAVPANISVQLYRAARVDGGPIIGIGQALRHGKTVYASEGVVTQDGYVICKVWVTWVHFVKRDVA